MVNKKFFTSIALIVAFFSILLLVSYISKTTPEREIEEPGLEVEEEEEAALDIGDMQEVRAAFQASSMTISLNETGEAVLSLDEGQEVPRAYQLYIEFNSNVINVDKVESGNLWSGENILQEEVDNETGQIILAVGQGFGAEKTGGRELVRIEYTVNPNTAGQEVNISLEDRSEVYYSDPSYVEIGRPVPINTIPYEISVSE